MRPTAKVYGSEPNFLANITGPALPKSVPNVKRIDDAGPRTMVIADDALKELSKREARALARAMRKLSGGTRDFLSLIHKAKADCGGQLKGDALWHQIATEMAALDAEPLTKKARLRFAGVVLILIFSIGCIIGNRRRV